MIRELCHDEAFLALPAEKAEKTDLSTAQDLLETLIAHEDGCVGMAANMIGVNKAIIAFLNGSDYQVMFNPKIIRKSSPYETEEGCLSLSGKRPVTRYETIKVEYENEKFKKCFAVFTGFTAQIIQHEVDHTNGILI